MGAANTTVTTAENFDDRKEEVAELVTLSEQIKEALSCAECCETPSDLDANFDDAIAAAEAFLKAARALRGCSASARGETARA